MKHELWPYEVEKVESLEEGERVAFKPVTLTIAKVFEDAWKFREDETQDGQYKGAFWKTPYEYDGPMFHEGAKVIAALAIKPGRNGGLYRTCRYIRPADGAAIAGPAAGASAAPRGGGASPSPSQAAAGGDPQRASIERQVSAKLVGELACAYVSAGKEMPSDLKKRWLMCVETLWGDHHPVDTESAQPPNEEGAPEETDEDGDVVESLPW